MKDITLVLNEPKISINVSEDAHYILEPFLQTPVELDFVFTTPGVSAEIICGYHLSAGTKFSLVTNISHIAPNTSCITQVREVLEDGAESAFYGRITIDKKANQTVADLKHNVLIIGENTKNISEPTLKIDANDVKAGHASTTGRIDTKQLYYLQSRGFDELEAKNLIAEGFLSTLKYGRM